MCTQLEKARLAFLATGKTPREVGLEKNLKALELVYRWGFSSPTLIDDFASPNRRGVCARLVSQGYLSEHYTDGGGIDDMPQKVVTLSEQGLEFVSERTALPLRQYKDRVNFKKLRHDILVQRATLQMLSHTKITDYATPSEIAQKSEQGVKEHDAIWVYQNGQKVGFELELTPKFERDFDEFVAKCYMSWLKGHQIIIGTFSKALRSRYQQAFSSGIYQIWQKSVNGHWYKDGKAEMSDEFQVTWLHESWLN